MGTDIHMIGERKAWHGKEWLAFPVPESMTDRNYRFFAGLANVRNGFGFAGVATHEPIRPLTDGRGFPADMGTVAQWWREERTLFGDPSDLRAIALNGCGFDSRGDHSAGYATLAELRAYDWSKAISATGIVSAEQFMGMEQGQRPDEYCGGISGPGVKVFDSQGRRDESTKARVREGGYSYVQVYWSQPLVSQEFIDQLLGFLALWAPPAHMVDGDPEQYVRILFDFDS